MAVIIGHWSSITEAQKLVQSVLLQGIIEEVIEEGQLIPRLPVFQISGKSVKYNRESTLPSAAFYGINEQIAWAADVAYTTQVEVELKRAIRQDVLDKFMRDTYKNPNDYEQIVVSELRKGCMRTIEDKLIYGSVASDANEFDGVALLCAAAMELENHATGGALSLAKLRELLDMMKLRPDLLLMPHEIARRIDAAYQEAGIASWVGMGQVSWGKNDVGARVTYFDGIPIVRSDYMTMTEPDGGEAKTGGTNGSIYAMHFGQLTEGGLCMCFGGGEGEALGEIFVLERFDKLEDYDAAGLRLKAYVAMALGSTKALAHLSNITDAAITA